ncbi:MAG: putative manganese-dependent inorganic diphosphatase [Clostridia bacterium]|nr:putative manganese-dependent inorganic diphosphatase [Clostridia bacterium]
MKPIYVIGHLNPDTDSICSAIAYAHLKAALTGEEVVAARAGKINQETRFVLDYFGVEEPFYIRDVKARVGDMLTGEAPVAMLPCTPLREVGILTRNHNAKTIPIVDEDNHLLGIITLGDIAQKYMEELGLENLGQMHVTVDNILRTLNGRLVVAQEKTGELKGNVIIGAMDSTTLERFVKKGDVVLLGDRERAQLAAIKAGAACLIITGSHTTTDKVRQEAKKAGVVIISVPHDTFATARLINMSTPVEAMMQTENIVSFEADDLVDEARKVMLETRFRNYPVVDDDNHLLGVVSRYHLLALMRKKVILVDHNEKSQAVPGLEQAEILEVIDHHRLGDVTTGEPIYFRNEPVGCTATIVTSMYNEQGVEIPSKIAGLLLGAILSDTVIFKSPTCTPRDRVAAQQLAAIAGVEAEEFSREMYKAGTSLAGRTPKEIIFEDFKEFHMGDLYVGIGQVETMDSGSVAQLMDELLQEMGTIKENKGYDLVLLMVTDILQEGTELLVVGDRVEVVEKAFSAKLDGGKTFLPGVMSRKKQVVPPLSRFLAGK